jgi:phage gp16-like protein
VADASRTLRDLRLNGIRLVHIARRDMALTDESYRAVLERVTGLRSAGEMSAEQLGRVLDELKRLGWRPKPAAARRAGARAMAQGPQARKARALWLTLYHLGEVTDPSEAALAHFARRQTGKDALQFLRPDEFHQLIEALKDWAARAGFIYEAHWDALIAMRDLARLQWTKLHELGAVYNPADGALAMWLAKAVTGRTEDYRTLSWDHARAAVEKLGAWIRRVKAKAAATTSNEAE